MNHEPDLSGPWTCRDCGEKHMGLDPYHGVSVERDDGTYRPIRVCGFCGSTDNEPNPFARDVAI